MTARLFQLLVLAAAVGAVTIAPARATTSACPTSNDPNELRIVDGSLQTAKIGQPFPGTLQVELANTNGCPLTGSYGGTSIEFEAPRSGTSGTFSSTGSAVAVVGTNAGGSAGAAFVANDTPGTYSVVAHSTYGSVVFTLTNTAAGVAATIANQNLTTESSTIWSRYAAPIAAKVTDANGNPVQGADVTFVLGVSPTGAGASFLGGGGQATAKTDSAGHASSPPIVANGVAGSFTASASTDGAPGVAVYQLVNRGAPTALVATRTAQTATVGKRFAKVLEVHVRDSSGAPVVGTSVTFAITSAAGSAGAGGAGASFAGGATQAVVTTDAAGRARSPRLVANDVAGRFEATASVTGAQSAATFALRNVAGKPVAISAGAAATQSAHVGARFAVRLAVTVTDANGNTVAGARVTFVAPARGATGRFGSGHQRIVWVRTDAAGVAVAPAFKANRVAGGYAVHATVRGAPRAAAFALLNT